MPTKLTWEDFWGSEAEYDLAQDLESFYEEKELKSAVLWTPFDDNDKEVSDSILDRPELYATCGYTSDFEAWGQKVCQNAVDNGCTCADEVYTFITNRPF